MEASAIKWFYVKNEMKLLVYNHRILLVWHVSSAISKQKKLATRAK